MQSAYLLLLVLERVPSSIETINSPPTVSITLNIPGTFQTRWGGVKSVVRGFEGEKWFRSDIVSYRRHNSIWQSYHTFISINGVQNDKLFSTFLTSNCASSECCLNLKQTELNWRVLPSCGKRNFILMFECVHLTESSGELYNLDQPNT